MEKDLPHVTFIMGIALCQLEKYSSMVGSNAGQMRWTKGPNPLLRLIARSLGARSWPTQSFRGHILSSIVLTNLAIGLALTLALFAHGDPLPIIIMGLHILGLVLVLRHLLVHQAEDPKVLGFCYLNMITWPLLQEMIGGIGGSGGIMVWMFMAPLSTSFIKDRLLAKRVFLLCISIIIVAVVIEQYQLPWRPFHVSFSPVFFLLNVIGVSMICYLSISAFLAHIKKLRNRMMDQTENIQSSIRYAKNIQMASLPSIQQMQEELGDMLLFYSPKDIVSGDFYWIARHDGVTVLAVADCTGHGVPGGFMTMLGMNSLNNIVLEKGVTDPAMILHYLHWCIRDPFNRSAARISDGMDIAICSIDRQNGIIMFSGAMSTLYRMNGSLHTYASSRTSVGEPTDRLPFDNVIIPLEDGDRFYLFSDGFSDQFGGNRDKRFGRNRMRELLQRISFLEMREQQELVEQAFLEWKGDREQVDDVLLLGFKLERNQDRNAA